jgi:hypothetical protein
MKKFSLCVAIALILAPTFALGASDLAHLSPVSEEQMKALDGSIDRKLLPSGTKIEVETKQVFSLVAPDAPALTIAPAIVIVPESKMAYVSQCGVFLLPENGTQKFVLTFDTVSPEGSENCTGVSAVSKMPDPGPRPRLLFLVDIITHGGESFKFPFVLIWDSASSSYKLDRTTSYWLEEQPGNQTMAGVRRLLARPGPKIPTENLY